jgi:hypothetical protein
LVISLHTDIQNLLDEGYSFEGIADYFATLNVPIPPATLKNYVGRARRRPADGAVPPTRANTRAPRRPPQSKRSDPRTRKGAPLAEAIDSKTEELKMSADAPRGASESAATQAELISSPSVELRGNKVDESRAAEVLETPPTPLSDSSALLHDSGEGPTTAPLGTNPLPAVVSTVDTQTDDVAGTGATRAVSLFARTSDAVPSQSAASEPRSNGVRSNNAAAQTSDTPRIKHREAAFFIGDELPLDQA